MAKKESLIVQFVYLTPEPILPNFCLRPIGSAEFSQSFPSVLALTYYLEKSEAQHMLIARSVHGPWSQPITDPEPILSMKCALIQAVVWTAGQSGLATDSLETFAMAAPAEAKQQPKDCFWVVDLETRRVLCAAADFGEAREQFDAFVNRFRDQV